ncbi:MAG: hypothetical protein GXW85_09845 [Clostridia bacterium]|nr:hypothetical protein [Clostridia bacterium]
MKCSQCGYEIKDENAVRCPRCFKSLLHLGGCVNCGKCSLYKERKLKKGT